MANGLAPAGAPNGFAPPPPPPPNGFAPLAGAGAPNGFTPPPPAGADAPNELDGREPLLEPPNGFAAFVVPKGLGFAAAALPEGANGLGALEAPPPAPALNVNVGAEEGAAELAPNIKPPPLGAAAGAGAAAAGADEPKVNGA